MAKSASLLFPFKIDPINNGLERANNPEKALTSAIKAFLMTNKNSRMGNPIGCSLPDMIQNTYTEDTLINKEEEILAELENQFPEVKFVEFRLIQNFVELHVRVQYFTQVTDIVEFEFKP
jgi:hypothetical protein